MGVSARIKQYGAMRAVGMGSGQVAKMITAEAVTYATVSYTHLDVYKRQTISLTYWQSTTST